MKKCPICEKELFDYAQRCDGCGARLEKRGHYSKVKKSVSAIIEKKEQNIPIRQIARETGIARNTVKEILNEENPVNEDTAELLMRRLSQNAIEDLENLLKQAEQTPQKPNSIDDKECALIDATDMEHIITMINSWKEAVISNLNCDVISKGNVLGLDELNKYFEVVRVRYEELFKQN